MNRRFAEWQRRKNTFSLIMIDVDHFKKLNDKYGHQAGDQVLRDVAADAWHHGCEMDLAARYGGEEFAIILPSTPMADALRAGERIRAAIAKGVTRFGGAAIQATVSIGVSQIGAEDDTASLISRADEALYAAKGAGRNRVWFHDGQQSLPTPSADSAGKVQTPPPAATPAAPPAATPAATAPSRGPETAPPESTTCQSIVKAMDCAARRPFAPT